MNQKHLTTQQLDESVIGNESADVSEHLESCAECRDRRDEALLMVMAVKDAVESAAALDESTWERRANRTMAAVRTQHSDVPIQRLVLALATLLIIAGALLNFYVMPPQSVTLTSDFEDEALLRSVQTTLHRGYPAALAPAAQVAAERSRLLASNGQSVNPEEEKK